MTKERGGTTVESTDRENRLKKEKEDSGTKDRDIWTRQRERGIKETKTERIDEKRGGTTVEARDRKNGLKKENERQR